MRKFKRTATLRRTVPIVILFFLLTNVAFAAERIHSFESEITVSHDGTVHVVETIEVRAEGDVIRRGILREIPLQEGQTVAFYGAKRDGVSDGSRTEIEGDLARLYIGKSNYLLPAGDYTYRIEYSMTNAVLAFDDHDQLYWNVTGNGWAFPIDFAAATVTFDADVPVEEIQTTGYTGKRGAKGNTYSISNVGPGAIRVESTKPLPIKHGLTVVAGIPKGYFDLAPIPASTFDLPSALLTTTRNASSYLDYNKPKPSENAWVSLALASGIPLAYFLIVWVFIGRDPLRGRIGTRFDPPAGISPAATRYLTNRGYDSTTFAAAVLNMAAQGHVKLSCTGKDFTIAYGAKDRVSLTEDEKALSRSLGLAKGESVKTIPKYAQRLMTAAEDHAKSLEGVYRGSHFTLNRGWWRSGCVLSMAALMISALFWNQRDSVLAAMVAGLLVLATGFTTHGIALLVEAARGRIAYGSNHMNVNGAALVGVLLLLFGGGIATALVLAVGMLLHVTFVAACIGLGIACWLFYVLMPAPTRVGRKALDEIEAFRRSLVDERLMKKNRAMPKDAPKYFDQRFAYAVALDAADDWAKLFGEILGDSDDGYRYNPPWYYDNGGKKVNYSAVYLARHLGTGFAGSVGSVPMPANTSSATSGGYTGIGTGGFGSGGFGGGGFGGGGGFSGGGMGGGGGGGW